MAQRYEGIIATLQKYGSVLTEHVGSDEVIMSEDRALSDQQIHDRDMDWIMQSDLLVAEVTVPSLGVGYEIGRAIELGKPVLCIYDANTDKALSAMISGSSGVVVRLYEDVNELEGMLREFIHSHAPRRTS